MKFNPECEDCVLVRKAHPHLEGCSHCSGMVAVHITNIVKDGFLALFAEADERLDASELNRYAFVMCREMEAVFVKAFVMFIRNHEEHLEGLSDPGRMLKLQKELLDAVFKEKGYFLDSEGNFKKLNTTGDRTVN